MCNVKIAFLLYRIREQLNPRLPDTVRPRQTQSNQVKLKNISQVLLLLDPWLINSCLLAIRLRRRRVRSWPD
jgi:hypothetical protein